MNTDLISNSDATEGCAAMPGSGSATEIQCPNGCDGLCSLSICALCWNTGWVTIEKAEEHARRKAKQPLTVEIRRIPFGIQSDPTLPPR